MNGLLLHDKEPTPVRMVNGEPFYGRRQCEIVRHEDNKFKSCVMPKPERHADRATIKARMREIKVQLAEEREARLALEAEAKKLVAQRMHNRRVMAGYADKAAHRLVGLTAGEMSPPKRAGTPFFGRKSCELTKATDEEILRNGRQYRLADVMGTVLL
mmetsp:Transcript_1934/g.5383  ORF Transcript_1934/g.5383 Transcript_1934/m.5383 type:complete len:158 (+) Transcript_1934:198-671(+)